MEFFEVTKQDEDMIKLALEVLERSFDDGTYYHTVGSAVRCTDGSVFSGVNCDGIHGSCAEFISIGAAITAGKKDFDTIVAVHNNAPNCVVSPCGNCRQMLFEYCPNIKVIVNDNDGKKVKVKISDLLPFAYTEIIC